MHSKLARISLFHFLTDTPVGSTKINKTEHNITQGQAIHGAISLCRLIRIGSLTAEPIESG